jgi:non-canonical (house-cleaning) NTP pyrophosphatase
MKHVIVASANAAKLNAVKIGLNQCFPDSSFEFTSVEVSSGVADQPMTDNETLIGSKKFLIYLMS